MTKSPHAWSGITIDCADPVRLGSFWGQMLGLASSEPLPGWVRLGAVDGASPVINFQPVPEARVGNALFLYRDR